MTSGRLDVRVDRVGDGRRAAALTLVLLPAAATTGGDFVAQGFLDDLAAFGIAATVVRSELPLDIYAADAISALLACEVLSQHDRAWLVGCSLGGMSALACAEAQRDRVAGAYAIAPWPGLRPAWSDIPAAGGVAAWAAREQATDFIDERRVWRWLGHGAPGCETIIGLARKDRFIEGQTALAAALAPHQVLWVDGAHDWAAWRALWQAFLTQQAPRWAVAGNTR